MNSSNSDRRAFWGLTIYALASLGTMATMSLGVAILMASLVFGNGGPKRFFSELVALLRLRWIRFYFIASCLLSLACLVSLVAVLISPLTFQGKTVSVHLIKDLGKLWYFFLPLFLAVGWRRLSLHCQNQVIRAWILGFGVISSVGVVQFFTGWPRASEIPYISGYYLTVLFIGHHLSVASIWIFPFFACLDLIVSRRFSKDIQLSRWALITIGALGAFCLFFSWSRTLWLAMPLSLLLWVTLRFSKKTAFMAALLFVLSTLVAFQMPIVQGRLKSGMGIQDRVELWQANLNFLKNRPLTGVGLGKNQELSLYYFQEKYPGRDSYFIGHAHNLYLEITAGLGLLGTLAWLTWLWAIFRILLQVRRKPDWNQFASGLICAWLTFFINGLTQVNFWDSKVLHQLMWTTGIILFWATNLSKSRTLHVPH
jgi:O-antigen ligase